MLVLCLGIQQLIEVVQTDGTVLTGRKKHLPIPAEIRTKQSRLKASHGSRQGIRVKFASIQGGVREAMVPSEVAGAVGFAVEEGVPVELAAWREGGREEECLGVVVEHRGRASARGGAARRGRRRGA